MALIFFSTGFKGKELTSADVLKARIRNYPMFLYCYISLHVSSGFFKVLNYSVWSMWIKVFL